MKVKGVLRETDKVRLSCCMFRGLATEDHTWMSFASKSRHCRRVFRQKKWMTTLVELPGNDLLFQMIDMEVLCWTLLVCRIDLIVLKSCQSNSCRSLFLRSANERKLRARNIYLSMSPRRVRISLIASYGIEGLRLLGVRPLGIPRFTLISCILSHFACSFCAQTKYAWSEWRRT